VSLGEPVTFSIFSCFSAPNRILYATDLRGASLGMTDL
jgi:hypothetical protein